MSNKTQPLVPRHRALLPASGFAQYFSGGPSLLISAGLAAAAPDFGFDTILATVGSDDVRFFRDAATANEFVETAMLPSDLLAVVTTAEEAAALCGLWTDRGQEPPAVVVVETASQAVGPVLARARSELAAMAARCAGLQRALVATRAEFEETRTAMQGVMRTLSHRYATKMNLVAVAAPARDRTVTIEPSGTINQAYPVGTELVTSFALHVADLQKAADAVLAVTLLGAESGRALGKWRRPVEALFAGWNVFDFPTPVAAVRETVAIELYLEGAQGCSATFSLSGETDAPLAIRIWTAEAGGRFPYAEHWLWDVEGGAPAAAGLVSLVGNAVLARIVARGTVEALYEGEAGVINYLLRGGSSLLHLADFSIRGAEGICVELGHKFGDLRGTRFELVVQSAQHSFASGRRSFEMADGKLRLGLSLPAALPDIVDLYLRIEDAGRTDQTLAGLALHQIEVVAGTRHALDTGSGAARIHPENWPLPDADEERPRFAALKATNYVEAEKYALFEVAVDGLTFGHRVERSARFKISKANGRLSIEFRQGHNWPKIFTDWPGRESDRFGEVFRVAQAGEGLSIGGALSPGPDSDVLAALSRLMPAIVAAGVETFPSARERASGWLDAARAFAAAGQQTFGGLEA